MKNEGTFIGAAYIVECDETSVKEFLEVSFPENEEVGENDRADAEIAAQSYLDGLAIGRYVGYTAGQSRTYEYPNGKTVVIVDITK